MLKKDGLIKKEIWKQLSFSGKIQYLWDYYKLEFVIAAVLVYIAGFFLHGALARKEPVLYAAMVNVAASPQLEQSLTDGYLNDRRIDVRRNPLTLYKNLYLTDNPSSDTFAYSQASQMKILGALESQELDIVFMDKEAFDAFAQNGFLYDMAELFREGGDRFRDLAERAADDFVMNMEIKEDNAKEVALDPSLEYRSVTAEFEMGIDLSDSSFFGDSGFSEPVYLGVLKNTPRRDAVLDYIRYLYQ